jgi:hypothetical protein
MITRKKYILSKNSTYVYTQIQMTRIKRRSDLCYKKNVKRVHPFYFTQNKEAVVITKYTITVVLYVKKYNI